MNNNIFHQKMHIYLLFMIIVIIFCTYWILSPMLCSIGNYYNSFESWGVFLQQNGATTLSKVTFSIMTLFIEGWYETLSRNNTQQNWHLAEITLSLNDAYNNVLPLCWVSHFFHTRANCLCIGLGISLTCSAWRCGIEVCWSVWNSIKSLSNVVTTGVKVCCRARI